MKTNLRKIALPAVIMCACLIIVGCPGLTRLEVTPTAIAFGADQTERRLTLSNLGARSIEWTIETLTRDTEESAWEAGVIPWLELGKTAGVLSPGIEHITLTVERAQLRPGTYANTAVQVRARNYEQIVPVSLIVKPSLFAVPDDITLSPGASSAQFVLENRGDIAINWAAQYFEGSDAGVPSGPLPADMTLTPAQGTVARRSQTLILLNWTQSRGDFGIRIISPETPEHDVVVLFRFGEPLTDLTVEPEILSLYYTRASAVAGAAAPLQPESTLTLRNAGGLPISWSIRVRTLGAAAGQSPATISVAESSGTLPGGQSHLVAVRVNDPAIAIPGSGNYELVIEARDQGGVIVVPLTLEAVALPVVIASYPPDPNAARPEHEQQRLLDFGRTSVQQEFWVVNIGPLESLLHYRIVHDDQESDAPLIVDIAPAQGDTNKPEGVFFLPGTNIMINAQRVLVTIDRSAMTEEVEYRNIHIEAWNEDYTERLDAVAPWQIELRAERAPMRIEGATNRSRPPFLIRFVFLMRDTLGRVIPTRTAEDLERIRFVVSEDGMPIDLNEVTYRVDGPEQLKVNLVVMLDYTGSMYYAGMDDPETPRAPGQLLDEIREAVAMFLDDLPPGYRVALMYHNDRQPLNRLIHPFSTDRESLKAALNNFRVAPHMHGVSDIWDALQDAVNRVAAEDPPGTLPFDDADVRAIVFITDGHDNASMIQAGGVVSAARDHRVRMYPLAYKANEPVNYAELIPIAEQSGGYIYNVGNPANLIQLLGHRRSLVLRPVAPAKTDGHDTAEFIIKNAGRGPLSWFVSQDDEAPWIEEITPNSGVTPPGGQSLVSITVNPALLTQPFGSGRATLRINSNDGAGQVLVMLAVEEDGLTIQQLSLSLRDEPGRIWEELQNQVVLSYVTPKQQAPQYSLQVYYRQDDGSEITGTFDEDGLFYFGDIRAGQIAMHTTGISLNYDAQSWEEFARAEVYVRADYVPRNVNLFRMRFVPMTDAGLSPEVVDAFYEHEMNVELAPDGLLVFDDGERPNWRLVRENDGIYRMLTAREFALPYAASGNLLRITFTNLWPFIEAADAAGIEPEFFLDMRVDNQVYYAPATQFRPSETVYFLYPSGSTNPERPLRISESSDLAAPARSIVDLADPGIDPEAPGVWDRDENGLPDFMDPYPDDDSRPGRLTRPSTIRFVGVNVLPVSIVNNRWDTFNWQADILTPANSSLVPGQFSWDIMNESDEWEALPLGTHPQGVLAPGERAELRLHFDSGVLPPGAYIARLALDTDVFGIEITEIEVQP